MSITAMKHALEALETVREEGETSFTATVMMAANDLRQAIEQAGSVEPYGWMVKGVPTVMRGSLAEEIQRRNAKHIGGDCVAFPVYTHPPTSPAQPASLQAAVFTVLEGFTLPHDVRKILETAYYAAPAQQPLNKQKWKVLAITTAYEQGVGKGHQAHGRGVEIANPYAPCECFEAWALGYQEGKQQASQKVPYDIKGAAL